MNINTLISSSGGRTGAAFALLRRWGSVEQAVAFDVVGRTSGVLEIDSASGHGVASGDSAPRVFFLCGQACPSNPAADCARDDIFEITGGIDPLRDVFGTPVVPDQTLHFQTGPRSAQDWSYSVRVRVD